MTDPSSTATPGVSPSLGAADKAFKKQKPISFQKMATIQEELAKIDVYLTSLRAKEVANNSFANITSSFSTSPTSTKLASAPTSSSVGTEHGSRDSDASAVVTTEDIIDPELIYMVVVELCQLCGSGDAVGVRILLDGGGDPNSVDYDGRTLLHIACENGHLSVVNVLLQFGADYTQQDRDGKTPIEVAEENGFIAIVQALSSLSEPQDDHAEVEPDSFSGASSSAGSSPATQHQPDFSSVPQPMVGSLIVIMVGLPGRGKTYVAQQIRRYFQWNGLVCNIFSHQTYKRQIERAFIETQTNKEALSSSANATTGAESTNVSASNLIEIESRVTTEIAHDLVRFVYKTSGVAILDGTQTTHARRQALLRAIKDTHRIKQNRVIFVEIVNNDKEMVYRNVLHARESFSKPPTDFIEQYYKVMGQHEEVYRTLSAANDGDLSFIRIEDNTTYSLNMISGWMPSRLAYMLHNLSHFPMNLYMTRSGEYVDMVSGRIGGNSRLTERGRAYSVAVFNFFRKETPAPTELTVMTSCSKRCTQTVHYFAEEATKTLGTAPSSSEDSSAALRCRVSYFPTLDDLNHGDCEGQLLSDVRKTMPSTLQAMRADPYYTAWPNGECIHQVFNARLEPHIHDIQASSSPVLVVSHLHLLQGLYAYFVSEADKTVAPQNAYRIEIPFESILRIRLVGSDRVAEVIDLSKEVDAILLKKLGKVIPPSKPKDDFQIFQMFRPPKWNPPQ